uniref:acetate--CoA ligase n=1 Tax=Plectus sambesii TaxID=2011161 RepID=A0A914W429_9BILA
KCANILQSKGVQRGDRVLLYLPMVFQLPVAMLACARIGAVHVNVPGGMSAEGLAQRVALSGAELIITVDGFWRGTKLIKAKETVDRAIALCKERGHEVKLTLMISHLSPNPGTPPPEAHEQFIGRRPCYFLNAPFNPEQDEWWADNFCKASPVCDVEWMDAEDPLFISFHHDDKEDKLQAAVYTVGGFMLQAYSSFKHLFDYRQGDDDHDDINENIFLCLHDYSTITGLTYGVYGPLLNGATVLQFEGIGSHPDPGRIWAIIQNYQVEKVLLTPSEVRLAMGSDPSYISSWNKSSLRLIAVAGEPLSAPERKFLLAEIGSNSTPLIEVAVSPLAGGAVVSGFPGIFSSTVVPYFGVDLVLVDKKGKEIAGSGTGFLCTRQPLPGMVRYYYEDNSGEKFAKLFKRIPGKFVTEYVVARNNDGEYVILGKESDVLFIEDEFVSPGAVETTLMSHSAITDAAVVCVDGKFRALVTVDWGCKLEKEMAKELREIAINLLNGAHLEVQSTDVIPRNTHGAIARAALRRIIGQQSKESPAFDGSLYDLVDEAVVACEKLLENPNSLF